MERATTLRKDPVSAVVRGLLVSKAKTLSSTACEFFFHQPEAPQNFAERAKAMKNKA